MSKTLALHPTRWSSFLEKHRRAVLHGEAFSCELLHEDCSTDFLGPCSQEIRRLLHESLSHLVKGREMTPPPTLERLTDIQIEILCYASSPGPGVQSMAQEIRDRRAAERSIEQAPEPNPLRDRMSDIPLEETTLTVEGTARLWISGRDSPSHGKEWDEQCICCEGPHIFGLGIEGVDITSDVTSFLLKRKSWVEGRTIRVTFEVLKPE